MIFAVFNKNIYNVFYNINYICYLCIRINHSKEKMKKKLLDMPSAKTGNDSIALKKKESIFEIDNLEEDSGFLMLQVSNLWKNFHSEILKKYHGLTYRQYIVLASIYWLSLHDTEQITQTMLAKHSRIDAMSLSHVFRGLEAKGYIHRIPHPADVRAKVVSLTQEGKELIDQAVRVIVEIDQQFFKSLGKNTNHFNDFLKKLLKANH